MSIRNSTSMPPKSSTPNVNSWLEDELRQQYLHDHSAVDDSWKSLFESNGVPSNGAAAAAAPALAPPPAPDANLQPLRGAAARIAENMAARSPFRWPPRSAPSPSK